MPQRSEPDWSELIEKYGPLVWKTVSRLVSHEADAADCFQETFVAAWNSAGREAIEHWPGFLKSVATTTALKRLRERYRQPRGGLPDVPATGATAPTRTWKQKQRNWPNICGKRSPNSILAKPRCSA